MLPVRVVRRAARQIQEAAGWWREHRSNAPEAFAEELMRGLALVSHEPLIGSRAASTRLRNVRRIHLSRIRYYPYYRVQPTRVEVLAFWHSSRGTDPDL